MIPKNAWIVAWSVRVAAEFGARGGALVHLVRAVRQPQSAGVRPEHGQRGVAADAGTAVHLDRLVEDPLDRARNRDLDGLDLGVRTRVADRVHQPGRLEDE